VPTGPDYYVRRAQDYIIRHSPQSSAPVYYLHYGEKYCRRFCLHLRPWLTPLGQHWIDRTCELLQQAIELARAHDPAAFAALEEDSDAFCAWTYATHAPAYIAGGIAALPLRDLLLIFFTIDPADLLNPAGLGQCGRVLLHLVSCWIGRRITGPRRTLQIHGRLSPAFLQIHFPK
jgi:hypothetical protein